MRVVALPLSYVHVRRVGAEVALHALLRHLKAAGHTVEVVTTSTVPREHVDGIRVSSMSRVRPPADVVITNAGLGSKATALWRGVPVVVWAHNNQLATIQDVRTATARGAYLVSNTRHMADVYLSILGIRSRVLHPPVFPAPPVTGGDRVTLVNLNPDKGADVLWHLAEARPDLRFLAVRGGYGPQDVRDLPNVDVAPHGDLAEVWARTRVLLVPSVHESYSMVGVEAAARGIPAVAADLPGVREALGYGAAYVADGDWAGGLGTVLGGWEEFSANAVFQAASLTPKAELDATVEWLERLAAPVR